MKHVHIHGPIGRARTPLNWPIHRKLTYIGGDRENMGAGGRKEKIKMDILGWAGGGASIKQSASQPASIFRAGKQSQVTEGLTITNGGGGGEDGLAILCV